MIHGDIVYMDHCAWQELSLRERASERKDLKSLVANNYLSFAISVLNLEQLTFGLNYHKPDSKRVRTAKTILDVASVNRVFKLNKRLEEDEIKAALAGRHPVRPFIQYKQHLCQEIWEVLEDLARAVPKRRKLLEEVREERNKQAQDLAADLRARVQTVVAKESGIRKLSDDQVYTVVENVYEEACRKPLSDTELGRELLRRRNLTTAVRGQHTMRVFYKAGLLLGTKSGQTGREIERDDVMDIWHLAFGAHADMFVTRDGHLAELAMGIREPMLRCVTFDDFLSEAQHCS